eukprot:TRINITY_DN12532_c0_g1_i2.p1 TRINITY_DN12532_c0_g1~~TRINITY_DN12532_c0_g1_i2.p1  ORF type:complete len:424 (-),score=76.56 TRINITY_DN12532_c0_g1_i2:199-1470(-)
MSSHYATQKRKLSLDLPAKDNSPLRELPLHGKIAKTNLNSDVSHERKNANALVDNRDDNKENIHFGFYEDDMSNESTDSNSSLDISSVADTQTHQPINQVSNDHACYLTSNSLALEITTDSLVPYSGELAPGTAATIQTGPTRELVLQQIPMEVDTASPKSDSIPRGLTTPILDIDSIDDQDPCWVAEYAPDISFYHKQRELDYKIDFDYMADIQTGKINAGHRALLVDWLVEVSLVEKLTTDSLFLTVALVDAFLSKKPVLKKHLQLLGLACFYLAAKYEEIKAPNLADLAATAENIYTKQQILDMEIQVLDVLEFRLGIPTAKTFVKRYLLAASPDYQLAFLAAYLTELTLVEYTFVKYLPSTIAACSVCMALLTLNRENWNATLQYYTGYSKDDAEFCECMDELRVVHSKAPSGKQFNVS